MLSVKSKQSTTSDIYFKDPEVNDEYDNIFFICIDEISVLII